MICVVGWDFGVVVDGVGVFDWVYLCVDEFVDGAYGVFDLSRVVLDANYVRFFDDV